MYRAGQKGSVRGVCAALVIGAALLPVSWAREESPLRVAQIEEAVHRAEEVVRRVASASEARRPPKARCDLPAPERARAERLRELSRVAGEDLGLDLELAARTGAGREGTAPGGSVGVRWDLLDSGLRENRRLARGRRRDARRWEIEGDLRESERARACRHNGVRATMGGLYRWVLEERRALHGALGPSARSAYHNGAISLDRLLEIEGDAMVSASLLDALPAEGDWVYRQMPPLLSIDTHRLRQRVREDPRRRTLAALRAQGLRDDLAGENDDRLSVYVRVESQGDLDATGVSAGITYRRSLFGRGRTTSAAEARMVLEEARLETQRAVEALEAEANDFARYRQEALGRHYRMLQGAERLREALASYRLSRTHADLSNAVERADEALELAYDAISGMEALYRSGADLLARDPKGGEGLVSFEALPGPAYRARPENISVLVSREEAARLGAEAIVDIASARGVGTLLVRGSGAGAGDLVSRLERLGRAYGIRVVREVSGGPDGVKLPGVIPDGGVLVEVRGALEQQEVLRAVLNDARARMRQELGREVPIVLVATTARAARAAQDVGGTVGAVLMPVPAARAAAAADVLPRGGGRGTSSHILLGQEVHRPPAEIFSAFASLSRELGIAGLVFPDLNALLGSGGRGVR